MDIKSVTLLSIYSRFARSVVQRKAVKKKYTFESARTDYTDIFDKYFVFQMENL